MNFWINQDLWNIVFVNPTSQFLLMDNGEYTVGVTDRDLQTIFISNAIFGDFLKDVLRHEICHAAMYSYSYEMDIPHEECFCQIVEKHSEEIDNLADNLYSKIEGSL